jgi:hypothetical protein
MLEPFSQLGLLSLEKLCVHIGGHGTARDAAAALGPQLSSAELLLHH